ncbi:MULTISPECIES: TlpA family protein disulfide reductase [unclassified Micromonospora]|uniref:TlpA family protein disulfide reductase n=1 Tax=unclassified Micromonospora TaxID=2617518 RepID=UPI001B3668FE|nr:MULTISPECIES: TlpA disulfide reductase family protein [unclassified Micromonospora]MBQ1041953.1 TlpA family protein disulfide reductase [Micromonospora sp. C72]MBQ1054440.1 TlpA family protein disulfide reductase [Micromonospora sp. C32]
MLTRRLAAALLAAVTAGTALVGCTSDSQESRCAADGSVVTCEPGQRSKTPKVSGELLTGGGYDISRDRGQVVVVNFWGSWCAPCRAEADDLEATYQATKGTGVTFLGINVQDSKDKALAFEEGRVTYPSLFDPASRQALNFDIPPNTTPATVVLDREGRIAVVIRRAVTQDELRPIVEKVAAESPPPNGSR